MILSMAGIILPPTTVEKSSAFHAHHDSCGRKAAVATPSQMHTLPIVAVYHFTFHAYRDWRPDHPRGYVRRNQGILPPDPEMARKYDQRATATPVNFDESIQRILIRGATDICARRKWRLHAVGTDPGHAHFVISWQEFMAWSEVMEKLKNILSLLLGRDLQKPGGKWFERGGSRRRVKHRAHLHYLINEYLPSHRGLFWKEGDPLP
jgi:REP element-mobilizing transposase RayT